MTKWEYLSLRIKGTGFFNHNLDQNYYDKKLNELGEQGWELVSMNVDTSSNGSKIFIVTLKRQKH